MIVSLLYVGFAVHNVDATRRAFRDLIGLPGNSLEPDPYLGADKLARIPFPNGCWLCVMESEKPESPVRRFLDRRGPGLERVAFCSDDIEAEFARVQQAGVPLADGALLDTPWDRRFVVPPEYLNGVTAQVVQPKPATWVHDAPPNISGVLGLQHIGVAVRDIGAACAAFGRLLDLRAHALRTDQHGGEQKDAMIEPGNDRLWLHVTESWGENARVRHFLDEKGEGLEHLCIEVADIREAVQRVTGRDVPIHEYKIFTNRPDGFEAFVYPEHSTGVTIELIEPYPTSRGYRPQK